MTVNYHKKFRKRFKNLQNGEVRKFEERLKVFLKNPFDRILDNHALHGKYAGYRSIDITGDLRAHYEVIDEQTVVFIIIGTHHELYGT